MIIENEFDYLLKKLKIEDITYFERFIYEYVYRFININKVEKMIVFIGDNFNFRKFDKLIKKLNNVEIFITKSEINNIALFHITHELKITDFHKDESNKFKEKFNYEFIDFYDEYCPYSISFQLKIN